MTTTSQTGGDLRAGQQGFRDLFFLPQPVARAVLRREPESRGGEKASRGVGVFVFGAYVP